MHMADDRLWGLLMAYLERRSIAVCPKVRQTERISDAPDAELSYLRQPAATRPPEPGRLAVFGQVWLDLEDHEQDWVRRAIINLVECKDQPRWLKGRKWRSKMENWDMSPRRYEELLLTAWSVLAMEARARGLI